MRYFYRPMVIVMFPASDGTNVRVVGVKSGTIRRVNNVIRTSAVTIAAGTYTEHGQLDIKSKFNDLKTVCLECAS